ncbi:MAG: hypothetical protein JWN98_2065, partial [Abditibacteriota bacterium]|nr:hypothetical protein [Abditibacteriota bacterium]
RTAGYGVLAVIVLGAGAAYGVSSSWISGGRIAPGILIQGEPVGGLTAKEAQARLEKRFGRTFVSFETPGRAYKLALKQVGGRPQFARVVQNAYWYGRKDNVVVNTLNLFATMREPKRLPLPVKWDKAQMRRTMWAVAQGYGRAPRDAGLIVSDSGVQVVDHEVGRSLNVGATLQSLQKKYYVGLPSVKATTKTLMPRLMAADLAGRDVLLGKYTTSFNSGLWGRTRNIYVAAAAIDGVVLMPNELFSFNSQTGERTWDKGYRMAHIFERKPGKAESEIVDGLAGGVCQVSSTLYNAVRKSNRQIDSKLRIVERNYHSLPVTYVPTGLDATVAWPYKDFKFRNTLEHPVYLRAEVNGSRLTTSVWGRVPDGPSQLANTSAPAPSGSAIPTDVEPPSAASEDSTKRQARL